MSALQADIEDRHTPLNNGNAPNLDGAIQNDPSAGGALQSGNKGTNEPNVNEKDKNSNTSKDDKGAGNHARKT